MHIMRAAPVSDAWCTQIDDDVVTVVRRLLRRDDNDPDTAVQRAQVFAPRKQSGLGMGSAVLRRPAAWLGAWEGGLEKVAGALGIRTMLELDEQWPAFRAAARRVEAVYAQASGVEVSHHRWAHRLQRAAPKQQGGAPRGGQQAFAGVC